MALRSNDGVVIEDDKWWAAVRLLGGVDFVGAGLPLSQPARLTAPLTRGALDVTAPVHNKNRPMIATIGRFCLIYGTCSQRRVLVYKSMNPMVLMAKLANMWVSQEA